MARPEKQNILQENIPLQSYYASLESRVGYQLFLGGTRHFGYYEPGSWWPFPIGRALRRMEDSLARSLNLPAGSRVLDAGCGYGHVAIHLARKYGLLVTGIDLVVRHIARARQNIAMAGMHERISIENMDYHHLENVTSDSFDGVYTMETFVHATHPSIVLDGFFRILKPAGSIALYEYDHVTPTDVSGELARNFDLVNTYAAMPANALFERGTLPSYLEKAGFVDVEVHDLSENMRPMLRLFFIVAYIPFLMIRCFGLEAYFINTVAAVVGYQYLDHHRYVAVTARKPWRADAQGVRQRKGPEYKD